MKLLRLLLPESDFVTDASYDRDPGVDPPEMVECDGCDHMVDKSKLTEVNAAMVCPDCAALINEEGPGHYDHAIVVTFEDESDLDEFLNKIHADEIKMPQPDITDEVAKGVWEARWSDLEEEEATRWGNMLSTTGYDVSDESRDVWAYPKN